VLIVLKRHQFIKKYKMQILAIWQALLYYICTGLEVIIFETMLNFAEVMWRICHILRVTLHLNIYQWIYYTKVSGQNVGNCTLNLPCDDVDIDECATDNGGCSSQATCTNTPGSFTCTCLPGYSGCGFNCTGKSESNAVLLTKYVTFTTCVNKWSASSAVMF